MVLSEYRKNNVWARKSKFTIRESGFSGGGGGLSCMHGMIQSSGVPHVICFFIMTEYSFIFIRKHVICFFIMGTR